MEEEEGMDLDDPGTVCTADPYGDKLDDDAHGL